MNANLPNRLHAPKTPGDRGRAKQLRFDPETVNFVGPKRLCWPTFDIDHIEQIVVSICNKMQHLGVFWPVSLEDLQNAKESAKDIHFVLTVS